MYIIEQPINVALGLPQIRRNLYGIEIELEGLETRWRWPTDDANNLSALWHAKKDASLRNGIELVSKKLTQKQVQDSLPALQKLAIARELRATLRCGNHIHVNMLNTVWGQLFSFITFWTLYEPELFQLLAPGREETHFCVPITWNTRFQRNLAADCSLTRLRTVESLKTKAPVPAPARKLNMEEILGGPINFSPATPYPNKKKLFKSLNNQKYSAMTAFRLHDLGTLEFRLLRGSLDFTTISKAVKVLGRMKHHSLKCLDPQDIQTQYETYGPDYLWEKLKVGRRPIVSAEFKEDAEDAAFLICGQKPKDKDDLKWNL